MGKPSRHRAPDDEASSRRRVRQGLPASGNGLESGRGFPPRERFCDRARHRLAAASSARTGLQPRTGAAAASARPALCTEFSTEIVETAAETFAGAPRRRRDGRVACRRPAISDRIGEAACRDRGIRRGRERTLGARRAPAAGLRRARFSSSCTSARIAASSPTSSDAPGRFPRSRPGKAGESKPDASTSPRPTGICSSWTTRCTSATAPRSTTRGRPSIRCSCRRRWPGARARSACC